MRKILILIGLFISLVGYGQTVVNKQVMLDSLSVKLRRSEAVSLYLPISNGTTTGTLTTAKLNVGNTSLDIDSVGLVDGRIAFYKGVDTLGIHIIVSDIEDLSDVAILKADSAIVTAGGYASGYDFANESANDKKGLLALGSTMKGESIKCNAHGSVTMADAVQYFVAVYVPVKCTITGVKMPIQTAGDYTADAYNGVGLYTVSGGTYTLVASSADDGNIWKATSFTLLTKAFSATYAADPGVYMVGLLYNSSAQTTAPVLQGEGQSSLRYTSILTNNNKICGYINAQAALVTPNETGAHLTDKISSFYVMLY
jgi:hypothetical protein